MPNSKPLTRPTAHKLGLTHYFTSKPCCRGHLSPRYVTTRSCVACDSEKQKTPKARKYQKALRRTPEQLAYQREYQRTYYQNNPEQHAKRNTRQLARYYRLRDAE